MAYINPLHPVLNNHTQSSFSCLSAPASSAKYPNRIPVPQPVFASGNKWQATLSRNSTQPSIWFGMGGNGFSMQKLWRDPNVARELQGANDQILGHLSGVTRITLHILWPGYEHTEWVRSIEIVLKSGPITRAQLGAAVANQYKYFFERAQYEPTSQPQWQANRVPFDKLVLIRLFNPVGTAWQAEVAMDL